MGSSMSASEAEIIVLAGNKLGMTHGPLFGQFIELAGHCIHGGLYDPSHDNARPDGIRSDVLEAIRDLNPTHIRYPGGCGATYFDWQELVGPKAQRPAAKLFRTVNMPQSTAFGIPEAYAMCRDLGCELYLTVNAHTQSPEDAANLVEYLNSTKPTKWANLRRQHGREEPFGVKLFSLGNEIYGNWQAGQKSADAYAAWCREAILQMKRVDPSISVVVCGLGRPNPEWDRTVMFETIGLADMISIHNYVGRPIFNDSMAAYRVCEEMFHTLNAIIDEAMDTALGSHPRTHRELGAPPVVEKRPLIAFDEWNVWYRSTHDPDKDLDETYNFMDALTVATLFHTVLRNSRTIGLSNISLAVNTLAGIKTHAETVVKQTIWHTQKMIREHLAGTVVETAVIAPPISGKHERFFCGIVDPEKARDETLPTLLHYDDIPALDVVAVVDENRGKAVLSVVQKLEHRDLEVSLTFRGFAPKGDVMTVHRLVGDSLTSENTLEHPDDVHSKSETQPLANAFTFPAASFTILEFAL